MIKKQIFKTRDEWLANRFKGLGGSDVAAVIGCNPFMTNQELYRIKAGLKEPKDISAEPYVKYGNDAEPLMRDFFRLDFPQYDVWYEEGNSFTNDRYPWALASLDGMLTEKATGRKGILEIKTSEPIGAAQWGKWKDQIPQNYYCQVLFYMAVLEADFAELSAQLKMKEGNKLTKHYHIERDDVIDDIEYIMKEGALFWEKVQKRTEPALLLPNL